MGVLARLKENLDAEFYPVFGNKKGAGAMDASEEAGVYRFSHEAMTTTFELIVTQAEAEVALQAALAVFQEIERYERLLSRFDPCSDLSQINRLRPGERVCVTAELFECLQIAQRVSEETRGAFDVTVGPLMRCWRGEEGRVKIPSDEEVEQARARIGMDRVLLLGQPDLAEVEQGAPFGFLVGVREESAGGVTDGVELDLGAIGKGYALDKSIGILDDWGIESAILHSGTSTSLAIGDGGEAGGCWPGERGWPIGVGGDHSAALGLDTVLVRNAAVSGSGKEVKGEHILDPRTGRPARGHAAAWVMCPSATLSDALSTAFMVMPPEEIEAFCARHGDVAAMVLENREGLDSRLLCFGRWEKRQR